MQNTYNRDNFIKACHTGRIATSTFALEDNDHENYEEVLHSTVASGNVFLLDQAVYEGAQEGTRDLVMKLGHAILESKAFDTGTMLLYFGDSSQEDAAALAFLVVEPPKDLPDDIAEDTVGPIFMTLVPKDDGFILMAVGQFSEEGVGIQEFRQTDNPENDQEVLSFLCGAVYQSYCQAMGLLATGALTMSKLEAEVSREGENR